MKYRYDDAKGERRITAYVDFLLAAYDTDLDGLADIAGISDEEMAAFVAAEYLEKDAATIYQLANVTGIPTSWLLAQEPVEDLPVFAAAILALDGREAVMRFPDAATYGHVITNLPYTTDRGEVILAARIVDGDEAAEIGSLVHEGAK